MAATVPVPNIDGKPMVCAAQPCGRRYCEAGWHIVSGCDPAADMHQRATVSVFVCTEHLPDAEQAMTQHMSEHAEHPWAVEVHRMYGWEDDGRGATYTVATGSPADHAEQMALF